MKPVVTLLAASALAAGMVVGGVVLASAALAPEENPHRFTGLDIKDLWTLKPVRIDRSAQNLERLLPRYASHVVMSEPAAHTTPQATETAGSDEGSEVGEIDILVTAAIDETSSGAAAGTLSPEHIAWCEARYRSYDPTDNSYRSFSGGIRPCNSPYQIDQMAETAHDDAEVMNASATRSDVAPLMEEHITACTQRYSSYRMNDNTYQPYGGGPRQTCEPWSF